MNAKIVCVLRRLREIPFFYTVPSPLTFLLKTLLWSSANCNEFLKHETLFMIMVLNYLSMCINTSMIFNVNKKELHLEHSPSNQAGFFLNILPMPISVIWRSFMIKWCRIQKIYAKLNSPSCANTHRAAITFKLDGIVRNIKIFQKRKLSFLWYKLLQRYPKDFVLTP